MRKNNESIVLPKKNVSSHKTTSFNSQTNNFIGPCGESKTISGNAIISGKDLLMMALVRFYKQSNNQNMYRIIPIIEGNCNISLRLIDWFVTNYSKKYNTIISRSVKSVDGIEYCNVYISYRQQLKAFSKQQFDPFRRRDRIRFVYDKDNNWVETTIGQLNFFKWVIQNSILDFIIQHLDVIEADMITSQKNIKQKEMKENDEMESFEDSTHGVKGKRDNDEKKKVPKKMTETDEKTLVSKNSKKDREGKKKDENKKTKDKGKNEMGTRKHHRLELTKSNFNNKMIGHLNDTRVGPKIVTFD